MSPTAQRDAIRQASADVVRLRVELVDAEQKVNELLDGEEGAALASYRADAVRALLFGALTRHHDLTESMLAERCSIHGDVRRPVDKQPLYVACDECCRVHDYRPARVA